LKFLPLIFFRRKVNFEPRCVNDQCLSKFNPNKIFWRLGLCWLQCDTYKLWNFSRCVPAKLRVEVVKYRLEMKGCRFMEHENYGYPNKGCKQCGDQHSSHTQFQPKLCHICCWTQDLSLLWSPALSKNWFCCYLDTTLLQVYI